MPKGIVETQSQKKKWQKAKKIAAKQGQHENWRFVMGIFKQMGGMSKADQDHQNVLVERALAAQGKKTTIPQEAHEALHSWWQSNKDKVLSPKQKETLAEIKSVKQKRSQIGLVKTAYLDEMYRALSAIKHEIHDDLTKAEGKSSSEWSQSEHHTPEELERIAKLVQEGYHPREAAHMLSPSTGGRGEPKDFMRALQSYVKPTQLSPRMLEEARKVAQQWLEGYESHLAETSKPEINPIAHASSKLKTAHAEKTGDYHKAYTDFLASDELKGKSPLERHKAVQAWKTKWKQENPEHEKSLAEVSELGSKFKEAEGARKKYVEEAMHHIVHGGAPVEPSGAEEEVETSAPMSARAISEHMGIGGSEDDDAPKISTRQDPSMKFATAHKQFVESVLKPQVGSAVQKQPSAEVVTQAPAAQPVAASEKPKVVIRRVAKPDQIERMQRVDAAKMALQTKKD
jgi:acid stress-induced BolA-like protein IbaG/YrbA